MADLDDTFDENPAVTSGDEYAAEWASLEEGDPEPAEVLPDLLELAERMLDELDGGTRGGADDVGVASDVEVARQVRDALDAGLDVPAEDAAEAVEALRRVFDALQPEGVRPPLAGAFEVDVEAADGLEADAEAGTTGETDPDR